MNKTILITGGSGFIGSNFILYFLAKYPNYKIINLDKLTYAGNVLNLKECENNQNYSFIQGDICNQNLVPKIFTDFNIQGVIHFAAESHVDNSIESPQEFFNTNIMGTFNLIHTAYKYWMLEPNKVKTGYENCRFHHISSDEVYGSLGKTGFFKETTAYAPNSPYAASKASSDFIIHSYHHTYQMNTTISNCSNNYGPKQHKEKLIPVIIKNALAKKSIPIYGDGKNVRDWLYVLDHCKAIDLIYHKALSSETYNIGDKNEITNLKLAHTICDILDKLKPDQNSYKEQITFVKDRAGHDRRYAIDSTKINKQLGWQAEESFISGIQKTVEWYLKTFY